MFNNALAITLISVFLFIGYYLGSLDFIIVKFRALKAYFQTFTATTELTKLKSTNAKLAAKIKRLQQKVKEKEEDNLDLTMSLKRKADELHDMTVYLDERRETIRNLDTLLHDTVDELTDTRKLLDQAHFGLQEHQSLVADQKYAIGVAMDTIVQHGREISQLRGENEVLRRERAMERGESVAVVVPVREDE
jgi:cell division protein FtsB